MRRQSFESGTEQKGLIQDQVKVKIRRKKTDPLEDLYIRIGGTPMSGSSPVVFGREHRDACDRHVQVTEVIFRRETEYLLFASYNGYVKRLPRIFKVDGQAFGERVIS